MNEYIVLIECFTFSCQILNYYFAKADCAKNVHANSSQNSSERRKHDRKRTVKESLRAKKRAFIGDHLKRMAAQLAATFVSVYNFM